MQPVRLSLHSTRPRPALIGCLCAGAGLLNTCRDPSPEGGCFREPGGATWLSRPPSVSRNLLFSCSSLSTSPKTRQEPPQWLVRLPPISAQLAHRGIRPLGRLENSPLPGEGLRVHEGHCERVWAHRPICLLPRGLAPPPPPRRFLWSWQAHPSGCPWRPQPRRGGCLRPAHQNPSPRTMAPQGPKKDPTDCPKEVSSPAFPSPESCCPGLPLVSELPGVLPVNTLLLSGWPSVWTCNHTTWSQKAGGMGLLQRQSGLHISRERASLRWAPTAACIASPVLTPCTVWPAKVPPRPGRYEWHNN